MALIENTCTNKELTTTSGSRETIVDKMFCLGAYEPSGGLNPRPSDCDAIQFCIQKKYIYLAGGKGPLTMMDVKNSKNQNIKKKNCTKQWIHRRMAHGAEGGCSPLESFKLPFSGKKSGNIRAKPLDLRATNGQNYSGKRLQPPWTKLVPYAYEWIL